jgi:hypothetical protein
MATKKKKRKQTSSSKSSKKKSANLKLAVKKKAVKKRVAAKKRVVAKSGSKPARRKLRGRPDAGELVSYVRRGMGARSGGQSGDTQGIAGRPDVDSESVEELLEEGQSFEAEVVEGVENAPDPDQGEVRTREVDEDDVPEEYRDKD